MAIYELIILQEEDKLEPHQNYGIVNTETHIIEARTADMPACLAAMHHLETMMHTKPWLNVQAMYGTDENQNVTLGFEQVEIYDS